MVIEQWTLKNAYEHVVKQRTIGSPHELYFEQVISFHLTQRMPIAHRAHEENSCKH